VNGTATRAARPDGFTRRLAGAVAATRVDALPAAVVARMRHVVLDWLGVTIAGAREPAAEIVRRVALLEGPGPSTLVGAAGTATAAAAALANGTAAHALDYDDSNLEMVGHPSAPVVSAVAAAAEAAGAVDTDALAGIVAGHDVAHRVGRAFGVEHYLAGWHSTGTVGTLAAAGAAARTMCLSPDETVHALAIAASQASGLRVSFATMAKPFQAGRAASAGVLAAQLARAGVEAAPDAIEARQGLAALYAPGRDLDLESDRAGVQAVVFKPYACCGGAHGTIDAAAKIVTAHRLDANAVVGVEIRASAQMLAVCDVTEPANGVEAKFSLPHVVALVLARRSCGPSGFTDAAAADPGLARLRALVTTRSSGAATGHATEVDVTLVDGTTRTARSDLREPAADAALDDQWAVLTAKFAELVSPWWADGRTLELVEHVAGLGNASSFVDLLRATR
jgi:2-methylcitrate dehydratase PrpD